MFNKKATIIHWILFGLVGIMGIYIVMGIDLSSQLGVKGVWSISFLQATQEGEKDLLFMEQIARETAHQSLQEELESIFGADLDCGKFQGVPLWNNKDGFCDVQLDEKVATTVKDRLLEKTKISYDSITISNGEMIGTAAQKKKVVTLTEHIPTEERSAGLLEIYNAYLIRPFYLSYEYNPSFRVKINSDEKNNFSELGREAEDLVQACQKEALLQACLDQNRESDWKYSRCDSDKYSGEGRLVAFCVRKGRLEYRFGLDFTEPFSTVSD